MEKIEDIKIITSILRENLYNMYNELKTDFFSKQGMDYTENDEEDFQEDLDETYDTESEYDDDDYLDSEFDDYEDLLLIEEEVYMALVEKIKSNSYCNLIFCIILSDVYEYIKTYKIIGKKINKDEEKILEFLELWDLNTLLKKINEDDVFIMDLITVYFDYDGSYNYEDRIKNKKLIELSGNLAQLNKFCINELDKLDYETSKRR